MRTKEQEEQRHSYLMDAMSQELKGLTVRRLNVDPTGTHLQGYAEATLSQLVALIGWPQTGGDKTTCEWSWDLYNGQRVTVYDWKRATAPGLYERVRWHIGGDSLDALLSFRRRTGIATKEARFC